MTEEKQFQPSEEFQSMLRVGTTLQYVGQFLLNNNCQGHEAQQHWAAIELINGQFQQVDKELAAHADYPQYAERRAAEQKARRAKAHEDASAQGNFIQPQFGG